MMSFYLQGKKSFIILASLECDSFLQNAIQLVLLKHKDNIYYPSIYVVILRS